MGPERPAFFAVAGLSEKPRGEIVQASGATARNIARLSGYTQGYFASGIFNAEGLQSSVACA
jgi:hypothetical protein